MRLSARRGYTLIELLVVIVILMILAGLTVGSLLASRSHQLLEQSAARIELLLDSARAAAVAEGVPVFLAVAGPGSSPAGIEFRALILLRNRDEPVALRDWQILQPGLRLMEDPSEADGDLLRMDPIERIEDFSTGEISGPVLLLVEVGPDGRFRVGEPRRSESAHLVLQRILNRPDSHGNPVPVDPLDALRLRFRPLTGGTRVERILP